jgi:glycosyltransferase involved in cell wall biosynthesis
MKQFKKKIIHVFSAPQSVYYFMEGQLEFINKNGFEIHVFVPFDNLYIKEIIKRDSNIIFHNIPFKREISLIKDFYCLIKLIIYFIKIKPCIIHLHTPKASFLGAFASKILLKKNVIYQMHGLISSNGTSVKKSIIYYLEKITCMLVDRIYAVSYSLKDFAITNNYCCESKISVICNGSINGIDFKKKFNPDLIEKKNKYLSDDLIDNRFVIGYIGRLSIDKGIEDFLNVCSKLSESFSILSVIVGTNETGVNFNDMVQRHKNLGTRNLIHFNEVNDPQNFFSCFNILLFPSKREGFGLVAAEANSMKIPVVAYDIPGIRDAVLNNITGKLVDYGNISQLEMAIIEYILNKNLLIEHGLNGRKRIIETYSKEDIWHKLLNEYQLLCK